MMEVAQHVRPAALAGLYYPAEKEFLGSVVNRYLGDQPNARGRVKGILAPHAGYIFSGRVAGMAFAPWMGTAAPERVVFLAPSHFYDFPGIALPDCEAFETPLGEVPMDMEAIGKLLENPCVRVFEAAHGNEHSIEVLLPFLQKTWVECPIVPLLVGRTKLTEAAGLIEQLWEGSLFVLSSELGRAKTLSGTRKRSAAAGEKMENLDEAGLTSSHACGYRAIRPFLKVAREAGLRCRCTEITEQEGTPEAPDRITGFGAFQFVAGEE